MKEFATEEERSADLVSQVESFVDMYKELCKINKKLRRDHDFMFLNFTYGIYTGTGEPEMQVYNADKLPGAVFTPDTEDGCVIHNPFTVWVKIKELKIFDVRRNRPKGILCTKYSKKHCRECGMMCSDQEKMRESAE